MLEVKDPTVQAALLRACEEAGLPTAYRGCVQPLLRDPEGEWPPCCGEGCLPCAATLADVAVRTLALLGTPRRSPVSNAGAS
ncbi:hypothetical protein JGU66_11775 [Myxococcaceae bacterium JPH2]|nr:hypothetical protein [Myxococcaceae bacterium JPH2]